MTTSSNLYTIESLHGASNFALWKVQISDVLTGLGVISHVNGTSLSAPIIEVAQAEANRKWLVEDTDALINIRLRVNGEHRSKLKTLYVESTVDC